MKGALRIRKLLDYWAKECPACQGEAVRVNLLDLLGADKIKLDQHLVRLDKILKDHAIALNKNVAALLVEKHQLEAVSVDEVDEGNVHPVSADGRLDGKRDGVGSSGIGHVRVLSRLALVSS